MRFVSAYSIRYTVPAALGGLVVLLGTVFAVLTWRSEQSLGEDTLRRRAAALGNLTLPRIERSMAHEPAGNVANELANLAIAPDVSLACVVDDRNLVRFSTLGDWEGRDFVELRSAQAHENLTRARQTMVAQIEKSAGGALMRAAFPFPLAPLAGELRPSRIGALVIEFDLAGPERDLRARILARTAVVGGLAAAGCLGLWAYLHFRFARRVEALVAAADAAGRGAAAPGFATGGADELAQIGRALDRMATQLRDQLAHLRRSEERYRDALQSSAIGVALVRPDGTCLEVNPALCEMLGYTREELLQLNDVALTHPDERERAARALHDIVTGMFTVYRRDKRYLHKSGRTVWAGLHVAPVRDATGRPLYLVAQIQDITARQQAKLENERFARVVDHHVDGAYWLNADDRIIYVNDTGCRVLGYTREELIGQPVALIAPRATPDQLQQARHDLRAAGVRTGETIHRHKDGTEIPIELTSVHLARGGEEINCSFARDLRPRQAAALHAARQLDELKRWQQVMIDREDRVRELKTEVNALCRQAGLPLRYASQTSDGGDPQATPPASP
ncbi:MAG: PAS domain S-box protein [Verrucomicrobia bacterium]|nr:PAS domain S-box protein [Verrucomicrobiota bacterium]